MIYVPINGNLSEWSPLLSLRTLKAVPHIVYVQINIFSCVFPVTLWHFQFSVLFFPFAPTPPEMSAFVSNAGRRLSECVCVCGWVCVYVWLCVYACVALVKSIKLLDFACRPAPLLPPAPCQSSLAFVLFWAATVKLSLSFKCLLTVAVALLTCPRKHTLTHTRSHTKGPTIQRN